MAEPTHDQHVAALRRALRRDPDPEVLGFLEEQGWLRDVADEVSSGVELSEAVESLVERYRSAARLRSGRTRTERSRRVAATSPQRPEMRGLALSRIFAIDAARDPQVQAFRRRWLDGSPLALKEVEDWLHARRAERRMPRRPDFTRRRRGWRSVSIELLSYLVPGPIASHAMAIPPRGPLKELKWLSEALSRRYGWAAAEATTFVLTDLPPSMPLARASIVHRFPWTAASTIELEISPRMQPAEVAALYRRIRSQVLGKGRRRKDLQTPVRAELAVFAFEHGGDGPWRPVMESWNASQLGRAYSDVRAFTRDCIQALRAIVGGDLDTRSSE